MFLDFGIKIGIKIRIYTADNKKRHGYSQNGNNHTVSFYIIQAIGFKNHFFKAIEFINEFILLSKIESRR